jgi:hypothetical protein
MMSWPASPRTRIRPFAGVHDQHSAVARRLQYRGNRLDRPRQLRDVIAEGFPKTAGLHEVALHVDDQERRGRPVEVDRAGLGGNGAA